MKNKLAITLFTSLLLAAGAFAATSDFELGRSAFNKKDYKQANTYLVKHLTKNPNDAIGRYYYAQTLTYLKNYNQAKLEYGYVIQLSPNSQVAQYSRACIDSLEKMSTGSKPNQAQNNNNEQVAQNTTNNNYLAKALNDDGDITIWDIKDMPLRIYIQPSSKAKPSYIKEVKAAMNTWVNALAGVISTTYVNSADAANVVVSFQGDSKGSPHLAYTPSTWDTEKNNKKHSGIVFFTSYNGKIAKDIDIYNLALHEIGHVFGVQGHSDSKSDVMYPSYDPNTATARTTLSQADINTVKLLYSMDRSPYATGENSINNLLGSKAERQNKKLADALKYAEMHPSATAFTDLGKVYKSLNQDYEAITYYKKALAIDPNDEYANKALARIYNSRNELKNAEIYYKALIRKSPKDVTTQCELINLYIKNNKTAQAKTALSSLIYRNPAAKESQQVKSIQAKLSKMQ